jgi:dephospho-CoA kinase
VEIFADSKVRFGRITKRGENADDNTKTFEEFMADHQKPTEITIPAVIELAKERIDNNGSTEDLQKQIDELIKKYGNR